MTDSKIILLVDDDAIIRETLATALRTAGHTVVEGETGVDCLNYLKEHTPALVLLDVHMPIMDGITTLRNMRMESWGKDVLVAMLTSDTSMDTIGDVVSLNVNAYIDKASMSLEEIIAKVQTLIPHT